MLKLAWPRAMRAVLAGVLVLVVAVIVFYFVSHRRPPTVVPAKVTEVPAKQVEKQEGIEHIDFRGERTIQVKAGTWRRGDDDLFYLEKDVEVRDLAKKGGKEIFISGDKVSYDKDWAEVRLQGNAMLKYGDVQFESSDFVYRKEADVLSTENGVAISSPKLSGSAARMTYSFKEETTRLEGEVSLRSKGESADSPPFKINARVLTYRRPERRGRAEGEAGFSLGDSRGGAEAIDFRMTDDEQYLLEFSLRGQAWASLVEAAKSDASGPAVSRTHEMQAEEMDGRAFLDLNRIHSVEARGGCLLDSHVGDGRPVRVRSGEMKFVFDKLGGLREYQAVTQANLVERGRDGEVARTISGANIAIEGQGDSLLVEAPESGEASVISPEIEITGRQIKLMPRTEDIFAAGNVKILLKGRAKEGESVGFFSGGQPVMAVAGAMSYESTAERLRIGDGARMWQEKQVLSGNEISVERATGALQGSGHVQAVFPRVSKKEPAKEEKLEVGGDSLSFSQKDHLLTYRNACWLKTQNISLTSDRIDVRMTGEGNTIRTIEAKGRVVIISDFREGRGNNALYDLDKETIDLTGNPSLTDKEKGVIEGDKLTFYLDDGRIHVENSDRDRSITVIKS